MSARSLRCVASLAVLAVAGCGGDTVAPKSVVAEEAAVIASVAPAMGISAGGTPVVITGAGLRSVTRVDFGTVAGRQLRVLDARRIAVIAPPHAAGQVMIRIVDATGAPGRGALPFVFTDDTSACAGCWDY